MTAKEYLAQANRLNELIEFEAKELRNTRELAYKISSPTYGERIACSKGTHDPMYVTCVNNVIDLENTMQKELNRLVALRSEIEGALNKMENGEERTLLSLRYVEHMTWDEIGERLHVSRRTAHRIHDSALKNFEKTNVGTLCP